ncbi:MBOAT family O-acyltransferase [Pseudomonas sp. URIL14HWK12:I7]|uniref:MBOAT family O-acyltransferase n=1 Tax=Pseudomonas sp. URIL14HWK12:I7 TaxID=1283285 RepID=UPI0004865959|nr:MBOAT family protein [Pseudomonas sp. URIL14HWK12:I7]
MLFTSFQFLFGYLPVVFVGFFLIRRFLGMKVAALWLGAASVFFYGWWDLTYVPLLLTSIIFNFVSGWLLASVDNKSSRHKILMISVGSNLGLLAYFKYANFFLAETSRVFGASFETLEIILPLGISFFTFTQIAFLVDVYRGKVREFSFVNYLLFVTWFPHLIAGPVLHHAQMMPQFRDPEIYRIQSRNLAIGFALICVGLGKKLLIADPASTYADPVFASAALGHVQEFGVSWVGALAYTIQIYFDFSGYCDMAVGLSMLFGIRLPINFNSPYKAASIIEFWRRWHMTLSQFLRDYLYISLGGNRRGEARRLVNLMATMVLGGLWHGANWTFIVWGGVHGLFLCINHLYQKVPATLKMGRLVPSVLRHPIGVLSTFVVVVSAWVIFRADSLHSAGLILHGMFVGWTWGGLQNALGAWSITGFSGLLLMSMGIVWLFPNVYEVIRLLEQKIDAIEDYSKGLAKLACISIAIACTGVFFASLISTFGVSVVSPFLYFQF